MQKKVYKDEKSILYHTRIAHMHTRMNFQHVRYSIIDDVHTNILWCTQKNLQIFNFSGPDHERFSEDSMIPSMLYVTLDIASKTSLTFAWIFKLFIFLLFHQKHLKSSSFLVLVQVYYILFFLTFNLSSQYQTSTLPAISCLIFCWSNFNPSNGAR